MSDFTEKQKPGRQSAEDDLSHDTDDVTEPDAAADWDAEDRREAGARSRDPYVTLLNAPTEEDAPEDAKGFSQRADLQMKNGQVSDALSSYREAVRTAADEESRNEHRVTLGDAYA